MFQSNKFRNVQTFLNYTNNLFMKKLINIPIFGIEEVEGQQSKEKTLSYKINQYV